MTTVLASLGLFICLLLLLRMVLRPRARERLDRVGWALRSQLQGLYARLARRIRRRSPQRPKPGSPDPKAARQMAQEAIRRARSSSRPPEGEWDGNVFRPRGVDWSGPPGDEPRDKRRD